MRDLASDHLAAVAAGYPPDKLIKLACMYELAGLPDCAAETLTRFKSRLAVFGALEPLLDALTPPLLGQQLSYREYIAAFERDPQLFLPSAAAPSKPQAAPPPAKPLTCHALPDAEARSSDGAKLGARARDVGRRIRPRLRQAAVRAREAARLVEHLSGSRSSTETPTARTIVQESALPQLLGDRFERMHSLVGSPQFDLPLESWYQLYDLTITFQPDLVLELGRGYGNSTCVFTEAAQNIPCRVVSIGFDSEHAWATRTAPRLLQVVGEDWFEPLRVIQGDIRTTDFAALLDGAARTLVFWDAHGTDVAETILGRLVPALPPENLIVVDDVWSIPEQFGLRAEFRAGPFWSLFAEILPLWEYVSALGIQFETGERWITFTAPIGFDHLDAEPTTADHLHANEAVTLHQLRLGLLDRASRGVVQAIAAAFARSKRLGLAPGWRFGFPGDEAPPSTLVRRDIWSHYRDNAIATPLLFYWYEDLRLRLYLGNDLSLCLYVQGEFEPNEFVFIRSTLEPGMVFLDGGANEGLFSLYAARRVGSRGVVLAVEPSTREFERLEANIALNRLKNVTTVKVALGSRTGKAPLAVAQERHAGMNAIYAGNLAESTPAWVSSSETVSVETIDELVTQSGLERLDLVKLDVEGSEVDALDGARATISRFRPTLMLEAEEARLASQGRTKEELVRALDDVGYELYVFDAGSAHLRPAELPAEPEGNAIAAPRGWRPPALG